jgi:aryl-phospho-beta-D-glucosidase BglC (GH1 family)
MVKFAIAAAFSSAFGQDIFLESRVRETQKTSAGSPVVRGVALNGLLQFEDWFFSWPEGSPPSVPYPFDEVSSGPKLPQGRLFPSNAVGAELVDPWLSEGALIGTTAARIGDEATIAAMETHRETYYTEFDFQHMAANGVRYARLAFGWWVFASNPSSVETTTLIPDPCYPELRFATVPGSFLTTLMEQAGRYNISILFDLHAMPCGSSDGTYNGIYPNKPLFYSNASQLGLDVVSNMMEWWVNLPPSLKSVVHGFTVLNEPGLGMVWSLPGGNTSIVAWLKEAVQVFEDTALNADVAPPMLYMNLHESAFPGPNSIEQMASVYQEMGLSGKDWAVFDVHHYFSWGSPDGNGIPAQNCTTDAELKKWIVSGMHNFTKDMHENAEKYDIVNLACSEWSLSLHHKDHINPCTAEHSLDLMHDLQKSAFEEAGIGHFFWGWRMPTGGTHEPMWSLKYHYTGLH